MKINENIKLNNNGNKQQQIINLWKSIKVHVEHYRLMKSGIIVNVIKIQSPLSIAPIIVGTIASQCPNLLFSNFIGPADDNLSEVFFQMVLPPR